MAYMYLQQTQGKPVGINRQRREISRWGNYGSSTPFMKGSNKKKKKKQSRVRRIFSNSDTHTMPEKSKCLPMKLKENFQ